MLYEFSSSRVGARISHIDCTCPTFIDDVALTAISKNVLNHLLEICLTYSKTRRFIFSWIKSLSLIFGRDTDPATDIIIGREVIKTVIFACHLGIPLTSKLADLNQYVDGKMSTSPKCYYTIAGLGPPSTCLPPLTAARLYSAICIPKLLYGVEVWTPSQSQTIKLERALSQAGRQGQELSQCASNQVSYQLLGWDSIETMISMAKLLYVFRVLTATTYHTCQSVLLHSLNNCRFGLQTRGPAADIYKCAIAVGVQTVLLSLLDSGQPIKYHQWKNNIACLVKKKQYTLHAI